MNVLSFDHLHLSVHDPDATLAFFRRHFGAEPMGGLTNADGERNHFLLLGGQLLVVSRRVVGAPSSPPEVARAEGGPGLAHFGLNVANVVSAVRELEQAGVQILARPQSAGLLRYAYVGAPEGVAIELTEYVLPPRLRLLVPVLAGYHRLVHAMRRRLLKAAVGHQG